MGRTRLTLSVIFVAVVSFVILGTSSVESQAPVEPLSGDESCPLDSTGTRSDDPVFGALDLDVPGVSATQRVEGLIRRRGHVLARRGFGHLERPEDARILVDPGDSDTCRRITELLAGAGQNPADQWVYFDTGRGYLLIRWRIMPTEGGTFMVPHGADVGAAVDRALRRVEIVSWPL